MLNKELINYNDKLFWVYRRVKENQIKQEHVTDVKEMWMCDTVLRTKNQDEVWLFFLREIEEAKITQ